MKTKYLFLIALLAIFSLTISANAQAPDSPIPAAASQTEPVISLLTAAGPGGGPHVRSFSVDGVVESDPNKLMAYADTYRGGVRVAAGDIDSDGIDEIITGTGENGGPHLRVFEKDGTPRGIEFFPFDKSFRGGMDVASGDFDGDGKEDIAVSQFSKGQAWVKVYKYNDNRTVLFERNVFGEVECGATVALGQLDSDSKLELIVGSGEGGDPYVKVFDYDVSSTYGILKPTDIQVAIGNTTDPTRTGIDVAAGDIDSDGLDEIAVSNIRNNYPWVGIYDYHNDYNYDENPTRLQQFKAYGDYLVGTNIAMYDIDNDNQAEIITGAGSTGGPQVRAFQPDGTPIDTTSFFAYDPNFRGGVDVGIYSPNGSRRDLSNLATYANSYKAYTDQDLENLKRFDIVTIDPYDVPDISFVTELKAAGVIVLAYIDIGEVETYRSYWDDLDKSVVLEANPDWPDSYYADVNNPIWHDALLDIEMPYIFQQGSFDGFMLDMLDAVDVYPTLKPGMIELVRKIRAAHPDLLLVPNRGFSILPEISSYIDAVKHEGLCATYDFDSQSYYYTNDESEMAVLDGVLGDKNMPILTLDHVDTATAAGEAMARTCYTETQQRERETGFNFVWYANAVTQDLPVWSWLPFKR